MEPLLILLAFFAGLAFKSLGYPAMPGYLVAGFMAHWLGLGEASLISAIADLGLLLLLFTIGLKLNLKDILMPQVWAVAGLQMLIVVPLTCFVIVSAGILFPVLAMQNTVSAWTLAFALSFSSTVFAVKVFEDRGETTALHAQMAIGVLVFQDILAVAYLVLASGKQPSLLVLLLPLLFFLRPLLLWLIERSRHGELVVLLGFGLALSAAQTFEWLGLKGGLGALLIGVLLSNSAGSKEIYRHMIGLKDLFLTGFFLVFKLRARTALLAGAGLFTYSEFGLVVAAYAVSEGVLSPEWLTTIALAVTLSFFLATPCNTRVHQIYSSFGDRLRRFERRRLIDAEVPADLGKAEIVILGMGRIGRGVCDHLRTSGPHRHIVGVDESVDQVHINQERGYTCVRGDASDYDFWRHSGLLDARLVLVSLTNHAENLRAVELARQAGFRGELAVVARYPDEQVELEALGCVSFNLYADAGQAFARHVIDKLPVT